MATQHLKLDFEFSREGRFPDDDQTSQIFKIFPTAHKVSFRPPFITVVCKVLPPKPWPVTVAGMPLFLTDEHVADERNPLGYHIETMERGTWCSGPKLSTGSPILRFQTPSLDDFRDVFGVLDQFSMDFNRLQWIGGSFVAMTSRKSFSEWRQQLPPLIHSILIGYVFDFPTAGTVTERDFSRHHDPALSLQKLRIQDAVSMDTHVNGRREGSIVKIEVHRMPVADPHSDVSYMYAIGIFVYFGNGLEFRFDDCIGAPLRNDDHEDIGQLRFQFQQSPDRGLCYFQSLPTSKDLGHAIAPTSKM